MNIEQAKDLYARGELSGTSVGILLKRLEDAETILKRVVTHSAKENQGVSSKMTVQIVHDIASNYLKSIKETDDE